jgi:hypothetical protein
MGTQPAGREKRQIFFSKFFFLHVETTPNRVSRPPRKDYSPAPEFDVPGGAYLAGCPTVAQ